MEHQSWWWPPTSRVRNNFIARSTIIYLHCISEKLSEITFGFSYLKLRKRPNIRFGSVRFGDSVFFQRFGSVRFGGKNPVLCSKNGQESDFFSHHFSIISRKNLWISICLNRKIWYGSVWFGNRNSVRFGSVGKNPVRSFPAKTVILPRWTEDRSDKVGGLPRFGILCGGAF
eukprot:sb/3472107/